MKKYLVYILLISMLLVGSGLATNLTATPVRAADHELSLSSSTGGSVTDPGEGDFSYANGTVVDLVATPASGYTFVSWSGDIDTVDNTGAATTTVTMNADYTIVASFASNTRAITASAGSYGSISPAGTTSVAYGGSQTYTFTPFDGYRVSNVYVDGASVGAVSTYTFSNVTVTHTISVVFDVVNSTITATAGANGTISPSGATTVGFGGSQAYIITPATGYHVADVLVDGASVGALPAYNFTSVVASHTLTASFAIDTFNLTATAGANGSISPSGAITVNYGVRQVYTITPNTGYHIASVLVDGVSVGAVATYTFPIVVNSHTITATFAVTSFSISATAGVNGTVSPPGVTKVNYGGNQAITIKPNTGYHINDVVLDGTLVGAITGYTFSNISADHSLIATFAINTYTITAIAGPHGSVLPSGDTAITYGNGQAFTIAPAGALYKVSDVLVDGVSVGAVTTYTLAKVTADHTIVATFEYGFPLYIAAGIGVLLVFLIGVLVGGKPRQSKF